MKQHLQRPATLGRTAALTGVGTLRAFREDAATPFALALRSGAPSALGIPDLDYLKRVNDSMGHAEGDQVLECIGAMLAECTQSTDVVGRRGGDEFAVLLPDTDAAGARIFFDRLHQRLLDQMRERGWPVGLCIGVALLAAAPPSEGDALRYADRLMYRAKRTGGNRVVCAEYSQAEASVEQRASAASLRERQSRTGIGGQQFALTASASAPGRSIRFEISHFNRRGLSLAEVLARRNLRCQSVTVADRVWTSLSSLRGGPLKKPERHLRRGRTTGA